MNSKRYIEVNLYAWARDHDGSSVPIEAIDAKSPEGYCVYVMDRCDSLDDAPTELFDRDFDTIEEASAAFDAQVSKHPGCEENIYSMPDSAHV